jgi:hypothetical protein
VPSSRGDGDEIDAVAEFLFVPPECPLVMSCLNWLFPWPTAQQPLTIEVVSERGGYPSRKWIDMSIVASEVVFRFLFVTKAASSIVKV